MTTRPATTRLGRRLGLGTATLVTAVGLSACQVSSPTATDFEYDPADGLSVQLGEVELLDVLVVSTGAGEPGVVSGYAVNESSEPVTLDITMETDDGERVPLSPAVEIPAGSGVRIDAYDPVAGDFGEPVRIPEVPVPAGLLVTLRLSSSESEIASSRVPVFTPVYPYGAYEAVLDAPE